jgi:hypothetical protein
MSCKMCRERGQAWSGSAPKCAFTRAKFSPDNWNCATLNKIRDLIHQDDESHRPAGIVVQYDEDRWYALITTGYANCGDDDIDSRVAGALYVEWYKHRGRTEQMWMMTDPPTRPTEAQCLRILRWYQQQASDAVDPPVGVSEE